MSKGKNLKTKALASVMAASMVVSAFLRLPSRSQVTKLPRTPNTSKMQ